VTEPEWVRSELMREYYRTEWGRLIDDDTRFFEFLCLEIFQAGLSWDLIIRKREGMRDALDGFDFRAIARYSDEKIGSLSSDARIIRNRRKLEAIRSNARTFRSITDTHASFLAWLRANEQDTLDAWTALFKRTFRFVGPEIVREFLESSGVLETRGLSTIAFRRTA
jgi:DNA-3-methyladenine glycosylase I